MPSGNPYARDNMKKESSTTQFDAQNYLDSEGFLALFSKYGNTLLYAGLGLIVLFFLLYRFGSYQTSNIESDFLNASNSYDQVLLARDPVKKEEALSSLVQILNRRPELNADYQGNVAQILLEENKVAQALPLANDTIKRVSDEHLADYLSYASTSLLIEQKQYQAALDAALSLKSQIKDNDLINALNLVRIALLQQELGNNEGELLAWQEWKKFAGWKGTAPEVKTLDPKVYFVIQNYYGQGSLSLVNYIESRIGDKKP